MTRAWRALLVLIIAGWAIAHRTARRQAQPHEPGLIAQSLAAGHGFSYPADRQWFYPGNDGAAYRPTAWQEPVWPILLAAVYRLVPSPERARDVILGTNALLLLLTAMGLASLATALFGTERGALVGMLAGVMLVSSPNVAAEAFQGLGSALLVGALVIAACHAVAWMLRARSVGRGLLLGGLLGVTTLAGSATLLFAPIVAGMLALAPAMRAGRGRSVAAAVLLAWTCTIAPWAYRNFRVFGVLVPVRTGFGLALQSGNPVLAETFAPDIGGCAGITDPPFRAASADAAMRLALASETRHQLDARPVACVQSTTGDRFWELNEAERDRISTREGVRFIRAHPATALRLAWAKAKVFYAGWGGASTWAAALALPGVAIAVAVTGPAALPAAAFAFALLLPYLFGVPYFYRYRYPAEPLHLLFAAYACVAACHATVAGVRAMRRVRERRCPSTPSGSQRVA